MRLFCFASILLMAGCATPATTEVDASRSSVKSKSNERRPTETEVTRLSVTTAPAQPVTYRLRVIKEKPCDTSPSSPASPSVPSASESNQQPSPPQR